MFKALIFILFLIICLVIIFLILVQDEQGEGLGGVFGGSTNSIFGVKSSSVALKITGFFIALFFIIVLTLSFLNRNTVDDSLIQDNKIEESESKFWSSNEDEVVIEE